jgi:hypothetical protein
MRQLIKVVPERACIVVLMGLFQRLIGFAGLRHENPCLLPPRMSLHWRNRATGFRLQNKTTP